MQPPGNPPPQRPPPEFPEAKFQFGRFISRPGHQELTGSVTWGGKTHTITWENTNIEAGNDYKTEDQARSLLQENLKKLLLIDVRYKTGEVKRITVDLGNQGGIVGITRHYDQNKGPVPPKTTPLFKQGYELYTAHHMEKVNESQTLLTEKRNELTALQAQPNYDKTRESDLKREVTRLEQQFNKKSERLERRKQAQELFFKLYPLVQRPAHMPPPAPVRSPQRQAQMRAEQERLAAERRAEQERLQQERQAEEHRQRDLQRGQEVLKPMRNPNKPLPVPPARRQRQPAPAQEAEQPVPPEPPPVPRRPEKKRTELDVVVAEQPQEPAAQGQGPPPAVPPRPGANRPLPQPPQKAATPPPENRGPPPAPPPRST